MEFKQQSSQKNTFFDNIQTRQATSLLTSIESRTAYLMTEMRQAVELMLNSEPQLVLESENFQERHQKAMSEIMIDDLERYAPQWANLIPVNPNAQSAVSHLLAQKYGLIYEHIPNIRQALGLDQDAVAQAYESQYGKPLVSLFKTQDDTAQEKESSQKEQDYEDIESELEWVYLSTEDILFEQGDVGDSLYIMMYGRLRVIVEFGDVREVVREIQPGEILGEMALLTGELRSATLQAVRDARLLRLSKASFERLIVRYPQVMIQIARIQSNRVRVLSVRPPHSTTLVTLAAIPTRPDVPLADFCQRLISALSPYGTCLHLTSERLEHEMQMGPLSHDENDSMIVAWLSDQEMKYRFIIYESDLQPSSWTSRCLRQADHILIVGQANGDPELGKIELEMRQMNNVHKSLVLIHPNGNQPPVGTRKWLAPRQVERHYHLRWNQEHDVERIARLLTGNGIGLVLSSGGARGLAHIGVIQALEDEGIPIDVVGGTSQGAWISGMYAMGLDYKTMMKTTQEIIKKAGKPAYTLPMVALLTGNTMTKAIKMLFGERQIEDLWLNFFCISANLTRGKMMVHQSGSAWKYVRASSAVPGIVPPIVEGNELLIDGVTVNNLPTDVMRKFIQDGSVFASNILPQIGNTEEELEGKEQYGDSLSGWRVLWRRLNPFTKPVNLPSIAEIIQLSGVLSNRNTVEARKKVTDFQVDLDVRPYGIFDYDACDILVDMGYRAAKKNIAEWKANGQWARKDLERFSG